MDRPFAMNPGLQPVIYGKSGPTCPMMGGITSLPEGAECSLLS